MIAQNDPPLLRHGTAVAVGDFAVMLTGPSGSGKSDLALRLIDQGGDLVADDQVLLKRAGPLIVMGPPEGLAGLLEVRGLGIVEKPFRQGVPLALICALCEPTAVERLPEARTTPLLGLEIPTLALAPFEASAPNKVRLALQSLLS